MDPKREVGNETDPRITGEYVHREPGQSGMITLVGVVHDHPASVHRVRRTVGTVDPDVLALELPDVALPLFEQYAQDSREPPLFGGEMSTAIQSADTASVVGIDRPAAGFFKRLLRKLLRERPSRGTFLDVFANVGSVMKHAVICRIAAVVATMTSLRLEVDSPSTYPTDRSDTPEAQARDERECIRRSQAFLNAFRPASGSRGSQLEDVTREEHMVDLISEHSADGDVVAVVGISHLDPLIERL